MLKVLAVILMLYHYCDELIISIVRSLQQFHVLSHVFPTCHPKDIHFSYNNNQNA
ncbi:unnamed protein product [Brugia timori]|uniref:Uncharacterized protein n=1 Tax=Brugia timori TaxID=42155 RepID=A0A0R3QZD5_9BILA|nr:unnamed protein product [Brugia timori]